MEQKRIAWIAWQPSRATLLPLLALLAGLTALYAGVRFFGPIEANAIVWVVNALFILVSSGYVLSVRGHSLGVIGLTERNWMQAMALGTVLGILLGATQVYFRMMSGRLVLAPVLTVSLLAYTLSLVLVVTGEEMFFRGLFRYVMEPAFGTLPWLGVASLAYAMVPLALIQGERALLAPWRAPAGYLTDLTADSMLLFVMALFLNIIYRSTGNLWSSGLANFLGKFSLVFLWRPSELISISPGLALAVTLALWAVSIVLVRRWTVQREDRERARGHLSRSM